MDSDKEYVEVFEDEGGGRDKRGRPAQLRRYKDDAYRSATHMHACTYLHSAPLLLIYPASKQDQHLHLASYLSDTTKHTKLQRHCASFAIWDP